MCGLRIGFLQTVIRNGLKMCVLTVVGDGVLELEDMPLAPRTLLAVLGLGLGSQVLGLDTCPLDSIALRVNCSYSSLKFT